MASIYQLKPAFQALLRPIVKFLARLGVTANQVTLFTCVLSVILGVGLIVCPEKGLLFFVLPGFFLFRMALNAIDGMLAREHNMKSKIGAFLNELTDVISDSILYYGFALATGVVNFHLNVAFVCLAIMSEMAGTVALQVGAERRYDGPMGKSDRAFVFGLMSLLIALGVSLESFLNWIYWGLCVLISITILNRAKKAIGE